MVTVEQILAAEGEELSRLLGEVLHNKESFEQWKIEAHAEDKLLGYKDMAKFRTPENERQLYEMYIKESPFDPIPLSWDNAMKWRDWAVKEFDANIYGRALLAIYRASKYYDCLSYDTWLACKTKPKHYLQAAAICKLNAEKGKT